MRNHLIFIACMSSAFFAQACHNSESPSALFLLMNSFVEHNIKSDIDGLKIKSSSLGFSKLPNISSKNARSSYLTCSFCINKKHTRKNSGKFKDKKSLRNHLNKMHAAISLEEQRLSIEKATPIELLNRTSKQTAHHKRKNITAQDVSSDDEVYIEKRCKEQIDETVKKYQIDPVKLQYCWQITPDATHYN